MTITVILVIHILVAIAIVGLVLIQHGKGADAGAAFGGGGGGGAGGGASGSVFGSQGSGNFLSRTTGVLATVFFVTSLSLAYLSKSPEQPKSLLDSTEQQTSPTEMPVEMTAPVNPDVPGAPDVPAAPSNGMSQQSSSKSTDGPADTPAAP